MPALKPISKFPNESGQRWNKLGQVYQSTGNWGWNQKSAGIPTVHYRPGADKIRVYYYAMDEHNDGRISYVDVAADDPRRVLYAHPKPILDIGERGSFDDSGVCPSCLVTVGDRLYLYYLGVQRTEKFHPYFAGLAISQDGGQSFRKVSRVPILERTEQEPFLRSACSVILDPAKKTFRMWYVSSNEMCVVNGKNYPRYAIRHAQSTDGIKWQTTPEVAVALRGEDEFGLGRPWVIHENGIFRMWYSIRSKVAPYRIGYAESRDGFTWDRLDNLDGLERSASGWDSEMICYPSLVDVADKRYLFFNGNGHGASGFGVAQLGEPR